MVGQALAFRMADSHATHYEVLDVSQRATEFEIKAAFRKLALKFHPDKGGNPKKFKALAAGLRSISLLLEMEDQPGTSPAAFEAALNELRWHRYHAREWASGAQSVQVRLVE